MESATNSGFVNILQVMDWRFSQIMQAMNVNARNLQHSMSHNLEQLHNAIGRINSDVISMKRDSERDRRDIKKAGEEIENINENVDLFRERLDKLEGLVDQNERELKSCNLRFLGVPEGGTYSFPTIDLIVDILNQYSNDRSWSHRDINRAYRVGERREAEDNPRPIIVQMLRWPDKMAILQDQCLREALREDNIRIAAELTSRQREMVDFYTMQGRRAYFWKGKLQVEDNQQRSEYSKFHAQDNNQRHNNQNRRGKPYQEAWPLADSNRRGRGMDYNWRQNNRDFEDRRREQPRVVPGHKSYSQTVIDGQPKCDYLNSDYHANRKHQYQEQNYREQDSAQIASKRDRFRRQGSYQHDFSAYVHRRTIMKVGDKRKSVQRQFVNTKDETYLKATTKQLSANAENKQKTCGNYRPGQQILVAEKNGDDWRESKDEDQDDKDQLSYNSGVTADTLSGTEEEGKEEEPSKSQGSGYNSEAPQGEAEASIQIEEVSCNKQESGDQKEQTVDQREEQKEPDAEPSGAYRGPDPVGDRDKQGDDGPGVQTPDGTASRHAEELGGARGGVSGRPSRSIARRQKQESKKTTMATRTRSSNHRSGSQNSIREAFQRAASGSGSRVSGNDKGKDKGKQQSQNKE